MHEPVVPGKLMLAGEYAVMRPHGRCLAVALGSLVRVRALAGETRLVLSAFDQTWTIRPAETHAGLAGFVAATLAFLAQNHGIALSGAHALNVAGALGGQKVGLGTSAAVTVATLRAVLASAQVSWAAADVAAAARLVHGAAQDPPGSGYDVTAIAHGGVIAYARTPDRAQVLSWPRDLFGAALFSGASASTSAALQRPSLPDARLDDIQRASDGLLQAWPGPVANTLIALESCQQASDAAARDDPTLTAPHIEAVRQAIAEYGAVTRTSGAGGGDCVLALSDDRDRITALAQAWQARGGHVVGHLPRDIAPSEE